MNKIFKDMLGAYILAKRTKWECYLPTFEFAYNSSKHTSTGYSPFIFMYVFEPHAPLDTKLSKGYPR